MRGTIIYIHSSIDNCVILINREIKFSEVCLLEIRLCGGDNLLFGCFYRSPTITSKSEKNNANLNNLLKYLSGKKYSHQCFVGDFNFRNIGLLGLRHTTKKARKHNLGNTRWGKHVFSPATLPSTVACQFIWYNKHIQIGNKNIYLYSFSNRNFIGLHFIGINFIGLHFDTDGKFKSWECIKDQFLLKDNMQFQYG